MHHTEEREKNRGGKGERGSEINLCYITFKKNVRTEQAVFAVCECHSNIFYIVWTICTKNNNAKNDNLIVDLEFQANKPVLIPHKP